MDATVPASRKRWGLINGPIPIGYREGAGRELESRSVDKPIWLFGERQGAPFGKVQGLAVVIGRARSDLRRGPITRSIRSSR